MSPMITNKNCMKCSKICQTFLANLCDKCFEEGKKISPPRQTGRTLKLIKEMYEDKHKILVVHNTAYKNTLDWQYPWLHNRIRSIGEDPNWMRSMIGTSVLIDHHATEHWSNDVDEFWMHYIAIMPPDKAKRTNKT